jgi:DNA polymerase-3 subunit epsilon
MSLAHSNKAVDKALELLVSGGPATPAYLCDHALAISSVTPSLAERLIYALLGDDPRFTRLKDGRWNVAAPPQDSSALMSSSFVVVDVETTGFAPPADRVIEIGMVRVESGRIIACYETLIDPRRPVPGPIVSLTGISYSMLAGKPTFEQVCPEVIEFLGESVFVAHNAPFDWRFVQSEVLLATGRKLLNPRLCTRALSRRLVPELDRRNLDELARFFNLPFSSRHRALGDAEVTAGLLLRLVDRAAEQGIASLADLFRLAAPRGRGKA